MKNIAIKSCMAVMIFGVMMTPAFTAEPPTNPNGFPSGDHFNLNLIGKNDGFECPVEPYEPGNVVFVPQGGTGDILLMSGSGRRATPYATFQVTDPCVSAFDNDAAVVEIPPAENGYWVYARALGKLVDDPDPLNQLSMTISPGIVTVSSTDGSETDPLVYLGYVTANGFYAAPSGVTITRVKGKHPAVPVNELFEWQGYVCYDQDPAAIGLSDYILMPQCVDDLNLDGTPETIVECGEGDIPVNLYCSWYDTDWVFNIADFVDYLWGVTDSGAKLLQIRFYPR